MFKEASPGYQPGPYSRYAEQGVIRSVEWYAGMLGTYLTPSSENP